MDLFIYLLLNREGRINTTEKGYILKTVHDRLTVEDVKTVETSCLAMLEFVFKRYSSKEERMKMPFQRVTPDRNDVC